ncbi:MAG: DUF4249 domain-containing protein [Jejuia sp.]
MTQSFEDTIVVEATITDELKRQQIKLSRTFPLEGESIFENNANVRIEDSNNNVYSFTNANEGVYYSDNEFRAETGISYKLIVETQDGRRYMSNNEILPGSAQIERVYAELVVLNGKEGVQVLVDTNDNLGNANFFRYEYEETYQIVAKHFYPFDLVISDVTGSGDTIEYSLRTESRPENQRVCYLSSNSNEIIITSSNGLAEQKISQFPVRFISADDDIIRDRYSILVKQYVQSADANNYYKVLRNLSSDESLLVDKQPGFIQGNVFSLNDVNEKVIGFFEVSSVTSKRIFFNYEDFGLLIPPYFVPCNISVWRYASVGPPVNERLRLYEDIVENGYKYFGMEEEGEYSVVRPECGDCTSFASNVKPDFWED